MRHEKAVLLLIIVCLAYFFYIGYTSVFNPQYYEHYRARFLKKFPFIKPFALHGRHLRIAQLLMGFTLMTISVILFIFVFYYFVMR